MKAPVPESLLQTEACNFIEKETLALVFSCEFCEIFKNTFFYRTPPLASPAQAFSESCQTSKMECFVKIVNAF